MDKLVLLFIVAIAAVETVPKCKVEPKKQAQCECTIAKNTSSCTIEMEVDGKMTVKIIIPIPGKTTGGDCAQYNLEIADSPWDLICGEKLTSDPVVVEPATNVTFSMAAPNEDVKVAFTISDVDQQNVQLNSQKETPLTSNCSILNATKRIDILQYEILTLTDELLSNIWLRLTANGKYQFVTGDSPSWQDETGIRLSEGSSNSSNIYGYPAFIDGKHFQISGINVVDAGIYWAPFPVNPDNVPMYEVYVEPATL